MLITNEDITKITEGLETLQMLAHGNAREKGFWDTQEPNFGEKVALMHSELSGALEGFRAGPDQPDKHCPEYSNVAVELADCIIRILDTSAYFGIDVTNALAAKMKFNLSRPYKHGKLF